MAKRFPRASYGKRAPTGDGYPTAVFRSEKTYSGESHWRTCWAVRIEGVDVRMTLLTNLARSLAVVYIPPALHYSRSSGWYTD
jgi:hypothetical protein